MLVIEQVRAENGHYTVELKVMEHALIKAWELWQEFSDAIRGLDADII